MNTHARIDLRHVTDAVDLARYLLVHDGGNGHEGGSEEIADVLGKAPGTVRNKANPFFPGDDFTVDDAVTAMNFKGDFRLLDAIANACGHEAVPLDATSEADAGIFQQFLALVADEGEFAKDIDALLDRKQVTLADVEQAQAAASRMEKHMAGVVAKLRAMATAV